MSLKLQSIVCSTRPGRIGPAVARWFHEHAQRHVANGRLQPSEAIDQAAVVLLDELFKWAQALAPMRAGRA